MSEYEGAPWFFGAIIMCATAILVGLVWFAVERPYEFAIYMGIFISVTLVPHYLGRGVLAVYGRYKDA